MVVSRFPIEKGYLFVHLPKTAGTSFRDSLEEVFTHGLYCDYGAEEQTTDRVVLDYIYQRQDFFGFGNYLAQQDALVCMSGHYPIRRYGAFFKIKNIMLFLRNPVQRVISQYEHKRRLEGYTGTIQEFSAMPEHMNIQSRNIGRAPVTLIGFVGLQEFYSESLQLLNRQFGFQIKESFLNINKEQFSVKYKLDPEVTAVIRENNRSDLILYKAFKQEFLQRYELFKLGKPYMHGAITHINKHHVVGWVIDHFSNEPLEVNIIINDELVSTVRANVYRPDLREWNIGRQAYVGFEYFSEKKLGSEDKVECIVVENQQKLFNFNMH